MAANRIEPMNKDTLHPAMKHIGEAIANATTEPKFYLRSRHTDCGNTLMFWNKDGKGYGTNLDNAHLFTKEEAQDKVDENIGCLPLLKTEVDALSEMRVDHQYLDHSEDPRNGRWYVIQMLNIFDGNDVAFHLIGGSTFSYHKAKSYSRVQCFTISEKMATGSDDKRIMLSTDYLDTICRRTFQAKNINLHTMVRKAGIKYEEAS